MKRKPLTPPPMVHAAGLQPWLTDRDRNGGAEVDFSQYPRDATPYTGVVPWVGIRAELVSARSDRKGERCTVKDVRREDTTMSGLLVQVFFETANSSRPRLGWFDYHWVRREE